MFNVDVIDAIIGVIGTLVGTVLGWCLYSLSRKGKLIIYVNEWRSTILENKNGCLTECNSLDEGELFEYSFSIDIYNSSSEARIMRNVVAVFSDGDTDLFQCAIEDEDFRVSSRPIVRYEFFSATSVPPKNIMTKRLRGAISKDELPYNSLGMARIVFLSYESETGQVKRVLISDELRRFIQMDCDTDSTLSTKTPAKENTRRNNRQYR